MFIQRHFKKVAEGEPGAGTLIQPPQIDRIEVLDTGTTPEHNFSERLVAQGFVQGFMTLSKGQITLHAQEDLKYTIKRAPGYYCCHCGAALVDANQMVEPGVTLGLKHVRTEHEGKPSPDPENPSGYCKLNHYETVLDSAQHAKLKFNPKKK